MKPPFRLGPSPCSGAFAVSFGEGKLYCPVVSGVPSLKLTARKDAIQKAKDAIFPTKQVQVLC